MKKEEVISAKSSKSIGPYSQAVKFGNLVFISGHIGTDPKTNQLVNGDIKAQTKQAFENLKEVLLAADSNLDNVLKVTVYLKNMDDFLSMNEVYASYFQKPYPARATVEVAKLPKGALIEIECIAYNGNCSPSHKASESEGGCCGNCCSE